MSVTRVAHRYAKSLVSAGQEGKSLDVLQEEVKSLLQLIADSDDLRIMLRSPIIKVQKKEVILNKILKGNVSETLLHFVNLVVSKGREDILPEILEAYTTEYNKIKGITPVKLTTSIEVDKDFEDSILEVLQKEFGLSKVELSKEVDGDIVGGFVLEFDHKRYDASVSHQLDRLKQTLLNA